MVRDGAKTRLLTMRACLEPAVGADAESVLLALATARG